MFGTEKDESNWQVVGWFKISNSNIQHPENIQAPITPLHSCVLEHFQKPHGRKTGSFANFLSPTMQIKRLQFY